MRKVIRGRVYDTDTAKLMGSCGDATLYRKRTGEYFIQYFFSGEGYHIVPMSSSDAFAWADEHLTQSDVGIIFGIPALVSDAPVKLVSTCMYLDYTAYALLRRYCGDMGVSYGGFVSRLISDNLKDLYE